jgi:hypothetical protein
MILMCIFYRLYSADLVSQIKQESAFLQEGCFSDKN